MIHQCNISISNLDSSNLYVLFETKQEYRSVQQYFHIRCCYLDLSSLFDNARHLNILTIASRVLVGNQLVSSAIGLY